MKIVMKTIVWCCMLTLCVACDSANKSTNNQNVIVNVALVKNQETGNKKEFSFIAKPYRTSNLSFRVGGPIDRFEAYAGNYYKRGDIIAEIDSRDFRIRKERAKAVYQQAKAEFERIENLYAKNNISASTYEKAKADCTTAKMAFETATNELNDTKLLAPSNGYIGEVYIEKYQDVKATQPIISLVDIDQLKIEVYVTQDIAFSSQNLENISLSFDAMPNKVYSAKVVEVSKSTTPNNLSYLLTALLPNPDGKLLAGMSGKVFFELPAQTDTTMLAVPQTALCHRPTEGDYVWVVDMQTKQVSNRKVTPGVLQQNGLVFIANGLSNGEIVAISGLRFLSDGMQVEIAQNNSVQPVQNGNISN